MYVHGDIVKYVIYLRVSTDQQVTSGLGLEAQRERCLKFIPSGSQVIEFSDEGFSGALEMEKRPALIAALNVLQDGDILLISNRDRIGRDPIVNAMIERAVERKKARLVSASNDVNDGNDPSSILMRRMVDAFAEYERLIIGMRVKVALAVKKNRNERVGHIPYGYQLAADGIHLEPNAVEQSTQTLMKDLSSKGLSLRQSARHLNSNNRFNRDGPWTHVSVSRVMRSAKSQRQLSPVFCTSS